MKKFLFSFFLLLTSVVSHAYDFEVDGICYKIISDKELTVEVTYRSFDSNSYTDTVIIPESVTYHGNTYTVTEIGLFAFKNCYRLTSVTIGNSVTVISVFAFKECYNLTSVTIGNSVTVIGYNAFYQCTGLTSLTIPNSVTTIGELAFCGCSGLTSITIPNSVTKIFSGAFSGCTALKNVYCLTERVPTTDRTAFECVRLSLATLHVPAVSLEAYRTTEPWSGFRQIVAIDEGDGIEQLVSEKKAAFTNPTIYDLGGCRTTKMQKGINLLRNVDGRVRKVLQR